MEKNLKSNRKRDKINFLYFLISLCLFSFSRLFLLFENNLLVNAIRINTKLEIKDSITDLLKDILGGELDESETKKINE